MLSKEKLESLKIKFQAINDSNEFWYEQIVPRATKLEQLCEKPFNTNEEMAEIEKLSNEVATLQKKGEINNKIAQSFSNESGSLLLNNLMSGISQMDMRY